MTRIFARALLTLALPIICVAGSFYALLNIPQLLFPYHLHEGRLDLWSDEPFTSDAARRLLTDAQARVAKSELDDLLPHGVVIANVEWHRKLTFLWNDGAAGLNWYPITRNVFVRSGDIAGNRVIRPSGKPVELPRTLAYYIAHEIGHTLTAEHVGLWHYHHDLQRWLREGIADYIGYGGNVAIDADLHLLHRGDARMDPDKSDTYALYRLLVAALLQRHGWTMERLLQSPPSLEDAKKIVLGMPKSG